MMRRSLCVLASPLHMSGYPIDGGKQGTNAHSKIGLQQLRMPNKYGDSVNWEDLVPEWFHERGGYEKMGTMPAQWKKDGFGDWLVSLTNLELEMVVYDVIHDVILEENLRDGVELRAPHPDTAEPLYSKIPSFVFQTQGWARPDLRDRIQDRVFKAFRIVPPFYQRMQITTPVELVSWVVARVSHARSPPEHHVPGEVKDFLDALPTEQQPELGFYNALPPKERTPLREAMKVMQQKTIDSHFKFDKKQQVCVTDSCEVGVVDYHITIFACPRILFFFHA